MEQTFIATLSLLMCLQSVWATVTQANYNQSSAAQVCRLPYVIKGWARDNRTVSDENHKSLLYTSGSNVDIVCNRGYRFPHNKAATIQVKCSDGIWLDHFGVSQEYVCERIGSCPVPKLENAVIPTREDGYMPGDFAQIRCRDGFKTDAETGSLIVCQDDGSWRYFGDQDQYSDALQNIPLCKEVFCTEPRTIKHGSYVVRTTDNSQSQAYTDGTIVHFRCDKGYKLQNASSSFLQCYNGDWAGVYPQCIAVYTNKGVCPEPMAIKYGYYSLYDGSHVGTIAAGTKVEYFCTSEYKLSGNPTLTCLADGFWDSKTPMCLPDSLREMCRKPDEVIHGDYNFVGKVSPDTQWVRDGTKVTYFCRSGYRLADRNMAVSTCENGRWSIQPQCVKRTHCDAPQDIPNGNWVILGLYADYRIGVEVEFECEEGYKPIGATLIQCLSSGYWSDYPPRCLPLDKYCSDPGEVENGYYMCKPSRCDFFRVGTEVHYVCNEGYEASQVDELVQTCHAGLWSSVKPHCTPVSSTSQPAAHMDFNTGTMTVVIATVCSVLGLLLVVMVAVLIQRRAKPPHRSRQRLLPPGPPPPPSYQDSVTQSQEALSSPDEHDRVALIAFADGMHVPVVLPSYDEVTRGRIGPRLTRFNSDSSHSSHTSSRSGREYRPLPSIPQTLRPNQIPTEQHHHQRDHHRNSIITTTSNTTRDNLSLAFGSMDTVNVSDATSTSVTIGTYDSGASNPSIATSQRATAGSIASSNMSLATEEAPLIERSNENLENENLTVPEERLPTTPEEQEKLNKALAEETSTEDAC